MSAGTTSFSAIFPRLYLQIFATAEIAFSVAFTFSRLLDSGPFMTWKSKGTTSETWKHGSVLKTWSRVDRILRKSGSGSIQSHKTGFTLGNIWSRLRILLSMTKYQTCTGCDIFLSTILSHHSASITRSLSNKYTGSVNDTFSNDFDWVPCNQNHRNHIRQSGERKTPLRAKVTKTTKLNRARESAGDQVLIGFSFVSNWLRKRREFSEPITERSKANQWKLLYTVCERIKVHLPCSCQFYKKNKTT